jgi:hypothetical protein
MVFGVMVFALGCRIYGLNLHTAVVSDSCLQYESLQRDSFFLSRGIFFIIAGAIIALFEHFHSKISQTLNT